MGYRKDQFKKDPIKIIMKEIKNKDRYQIIKKTNVKINEIFKFAEKDKFPTKKDLLTHNYAD